MRAAGATVPPEVARREASASFWALAAALESYERSAMLIDRSLIRGVQESLSPWLLRSRHFARASTKPHGYAPDWQLWQGIYELESDPCADPMQPAVVNCLDHLFASLHAVRARWQERRLLVSAVMRAYARTDGTPRILAIGPGALLPLGEYLSALRDPTGVELTVLDPDPATLGYAEAGALLPFEGQLTCVQAPLAHLGEALSGEWDLILAPALADGLDDCEAREAYAHLASCLGTRGALMTSAHHPGDRSRVVRRWLLDWPGFCRDEQGLDDLLPEALRAEIVVSENRALTFALARK
jgi:hypothetical protein